jgi:hypothetical protein
MLNNDMDSKLLDNSLMLGSRVGQGPQFYNTMFNHTARHVHKTRAVIWLEPSPSETHVIVYPPLPVHIFTIASKQIATNVFKHLYCRLPFLASAHSLRS